jgi:hypothetical protein
MDLLVVFFGTPLEKIYNSVRSRSAKQQCFTAGGAGLEPNIHGRLGRKSWVGTRIR